MTKNKIDMGGGAKNTGKRKIKDQRDALKGKGGERK